MTVRVGYRGNEKIIYSSSGGTLTTTTSSIKPTSSSSGSSGSGSSQASQPTQTKIPTLQEYISQKENQAGMSFGSQLRQQATNEYYSQYASSQAPSTVSRGGGAGGTSGTTSTERALNQSLPSNLRNKSVEEVQQQQQRQSLARTPVMNTSQSMSSQTRQQAAYAQQQYIPATSFGGQSTINPNAERFIPPKYNPITEKLIPENLLSSFDKTRESLERERIQQVGKLQKENSPIQAKVISAGYKGFELGLSTTKNVLQYAKENPEEIVITAGLGMGTRVGLGLLGAGATALNVGKGFAIGERVAGYGLAGAYGGNVAANVYTNLKSENIEGAGQVLGKSIVETGAFVGGYSLGGGVPVGKGTIRTVEQINRISAQASGLGAEPRQAFKDLSKEYLKAPRSQPQVTDIPFNKIENVKAEEAPIIEKVLSKYKEQFTLGGSGGAATQSKTDVIRDLDIETTKQKELSESITKDLQTEFKKVGLKSSEQIKLEPGEQPSISLRGKKLAEFVDYTNLKGNIETFRNAFRTPSTYIKTTPKGFKVESLEISFPSKIMGGQGGAFAIEKKPEQGIQKLYRYPKDITRTELYGTSIYESAISKAKESKVLPKAKVGALELQKQKFVETVGKYKNLKTEYPLPPTIGQRFTSSLKIGITNLKDIFPKLGRQETIGGKGTMLVSEAKAIDKMERDVAREMRREQRVGRKETKEVKPSRETYKPSREVYKPIKPQTYTFPKGTLKPPYEKTYGTGKTYNYEPPYKAPPYIPKEDLPYKPYEPPYKAPPYTYKEPPYKEPPYQYTPPYNPPYKPYDDIYESYRKVPPGLPPYGSPIGGGGLGGSIGIPSKVKGKKGLSPSLYAVVKNIRGPLEFKERTGLEVRPIPTSAGKNIYTEFQKKIGGF